MQERESLSFVASTSYASRVHGIVSCSIKYRGGAINLDGIQAVCMHVPPVCKLVGAAKLYIARCTCLIINVISLYYIIYNFSKHA